jgi:hypothetical protein
MKKMLRAIPTRVIGKVTIHSSWPSSAQRLLTLPTSTACFHAAARPYTPFRPLSIARHMVSVIDTLSALARRRIASRSALGGRNAMSGVTPVAGLPLFFCKTVIDLAI